MKKAHLIFALFWAVGFTHLSGMSLKKILSIGSNDKNYIFSAISSARFDEARNIYVSDAQGSFIRKYDKEGRFMKEIGRRGQGPGDFGDAIDIYWDGNLHVLDGRNSRIAVLDEKLNIMRYIRISGLAHKLIRLNDLYYCNAGAFEPNQNKIVVFDDKGSVPFSFHRDSPDYLPKSALSKADKAMNIMHGGIEIDGHGKVNEIVATYRDPGKALELFFYSAGGKLLRKQEIEHPIKYEFPSYLLKWPPVYPEKSTLVMVRSIRYTKADQVLIHYAYSFFKNSKGYETHSFLLRIDSVLGSIVDKIEIDSNLEVMDIRDGLLCAKYSGDNGQELQLYEIKF